MTETKITEQERQEIKYYYDRLEKSTKNQIAFLPYIMKSMGQYLSLHEEFEINKLAQNTEKLDLNTIVSIAEKYWKDVKSNIERAVYDLDRFNTGFIKLDYFIKILYEYGEPLSEKEFKKLVKYLFGQKEELSCSDAIKILLDSNKKREKKKKKKKPSRKKVGGYQANKKYRSVTRTMQKK